MADKHATLNVGDQSYEFPVLEGSVGVAADPIEHPEEGLAECPYRRLCSISAVGAAGAAVPVGHRRHQHIGA